MIQIFTLIYNWMAPELTRAENHKYQDAYYDSYLKKMFIFQFINQYSAMLFIAVKQQFMEGGFKKTVLLANDRRRPQLTDRPRSSD